QTCALPIYAERVPASELDAEVERPDQEGEDRDEEDRGRDAVPDLAPANDLQVGLAPVEPAREILETVARLPHGSRRPIAHLTPPSCVSNRSRSPGGAGRAPGPGRLRAARGTPASGPTAS